MLNGTKWVWKKDHWVWDQRGLPVKYRSGCQVCGRRSGRLQALMGFHNRFPFVCSNPCKLMALLKWE